MDAERASEGPAGIAALRVDLLRGALTFMALGLPLLGVVMLVQASRLGPLDGTALFILAYVLTFPLLRLLLGRLPFRVAALAFVVLLGLLALLVQARGGPNGGSVALQLIFIVLCGALFGRAGAVLAVSLSLLSLGLAAWLVLAEHLPPIQEAMWDPREGETWLRGALALGLFGAATAAAVGYVVNRLEVETSALRKALERERGERAAREEAVAERERARTAMEAVQRMEVLGRMAGGVAHDFNNLLTVILSCTAALKHDLGGQRPAELELVEDIAAAGERAREVTRQLLTFARRQVISPVALDLGALVRDTEKLARRVLGEAVAVEVKTPPGLWTVRCDPGHVEQVVLNLAVNARDAMPDGGTFTIETSNVEIDAGRRAAHPFLREGPYVQLTIRDSGHGMSPEVKAHAFEPFFTTKPEGRGTGLGLATVYGIVKQSGGYVLVDSAPGRGTTFEVLLPRVAAPPLEVPVSAPRAPARGTETVLVVEDDAQVREVTVRALQAGGYTVLVAADGREAVELAERHEGALDLVVTDIIMPGLNGREVAGVLRRDRPDLRILYVSGYTQDVISQAGVLDAGIAFLPKPFTAEVLQERVRRVLDSGWIQKLVTGIDDIDAQHRTLLVSIGGLEEAARSGEHDRALDMLGAIEGLVTDHFATEEQVMRSAGYPDLAGHRALHQAFTSEYLQRQGDFVASGLSVPRLLELAEWLNDWLHAHVRSADTRMAGFLRSERGGRAAGARRA